MYQGVCVRRVVGDVEEDVDFVRFMIGLWNVGGNEDIDLCLQKNKICPQSSKKKKYIFITNNKQSLVPPSGF